MLTRGQPKEMRTSARRLFTGASCGQPSGRNRLPHGPMGLKLRYEKGSGPAIDNPVRTSDDVDSLSTAYTDDLGYVGEAIQATVRALAGRVPVIGFVGAPFTMASYMIEGGASRNFIRTKKLMYSDE